MNSWRKKLAFQDRRTLAIAAAALGAVSCDRDISENPQLYSQAIKALARRLISGETPLRSLAACVGETEALRLAPPAALASEERRLRDAGEHGSWHRAVQLARNDGFIERQPVRDIRIPTRHRTKSSGWTPPSKRHPWDEIDSKMIDMALCREWGHSPGVAAGIYVYARHPSGRRYRRQPAPTPPAPRGKGDK
jgi:hypothetical protein